MKIISLIFKKKCAEEVREIIEDYKGFLKIYIEEYEKEDLEFKTEEVKGTIEMDGLVKDFLIENHNRRVKSSPILRYLFAIKYNNIDTLCTKIIDSL